LASDLSSLSIRTYDKISSEVFASVGAKATSISFADTMPRLVDGSINAVLSSGDGGAGRKLWEHLPYFTEIGYAVPLSFATLATPLYDRLPNELKEAVDRAAAATQAHGWAQLSTRLEENYARMRANGVTITPASEVTPELFGLLARGAASAVEKWKRDAGAEAAKLL
jgi:TRAP-type transport system periplasmic protein